MGISAKTWLLINSKLGENMDLSSKYMGLTLHNPLIVSASPLSKERDNFRRMEEAGAAAVVFHSLFEEQLRHEANELDHFLMEGTESYSEALSYFPQISSFKVGPDEYLENIRFAVENTSIPVIGSLNGVSAGGWIDFAKQIEQAGAHGLELNIYYLPTNPDLDSAAIETKYVETVKAVKSAVKIPVAVKLSPWFTAMANMAKKLDEAGADALVLFNRFYQPDFDLDKLEVVPDLQLSNSYEMRLPLRWIAILHGRLKASLAGSTGVHTAADAIKYLMAGADSVMLASSLLKNGIWHLQTILREMSAWMEEHEYESVQQMIGSMSQKSVAEPAAFERANYMKVLQSYKPRP
jgi:dihydroorotate dehydrogenase (fumarate)